MSLIDEIVLPALASVNPSNAGILPEPNSPTYSL
jgi:hypothetical protein